MLNFSRRLPSFAQPVARFQHGPSDEKERSMKSDRIKHFPAEVALVKTHCCEIRNFF
jgi:hypothetical protein